MQLSRADAIDEPIATGGLLAMEKITVAEARQADVGRQAGAAARLGPHAARLQGRLQLPRAQRRLLLRQHPGHRRGSAAELRERDQAAHGRLQRDRRGRGQGVAGQGPGDRSAGHAASTVHGRADPETYPLQKKRHSFEFLRTHRPSAAAHQHLRRHRPGAELRLPLDPRVLPGTRASSTSTRRSSPPATAKGPARCSRSPRSTWPRCRKTRTGRSTTRRTSSIGRRILTVSGQLEAEIFACALGKVYTFGPTFRAENSNTLAAPGRVLDGRAGDGLLRPRPTTWTWPSSS